MLEDDLPTAIIIDSEPEGDAQTDPAALYRQYVQLPSDPVSQSSPPPMSIDLVPAQVKAIESARTTLTIKVGGDNYSLRCTEEAVNELVLASFLFGGYPAVLRARKSIENAMRELEGQYGSERETQRQAAIMATSHPQDPAIRRNADAARIGLVNAKVDWQRARDSEPYYHEYFRQAWQALAELEEHWLRQYEKEAETVFEDLAKTSLKLAKKNWEKYKPYLKGDQNQTFVEFDKADIKEEYRLKIDNDPQKKKAKIDELTQQALSFEIYSQNLAYSKANESSQSINDRFKLWKEERDKIAQNDPILLHVYAEVRRTAGNGGKLQAVMAEALLKARDEAKRIIAERLRLMHNTLRITPLEHGVRLLQDSNYFSLYSNLPEEYRDGLEKYGLTLPASAVLARQLRKRELALNSPWMHLPVRLDIFEKGKKGQPQSLIAYADPAAFEYAAIKHLWDALEEVREEEQAAKTRRAIVLAIVGAGLAPFTEGVSLVAAALVQAALSASEIAEAVTDFNQQARLAAMLAPVEAVVWTRPAVGDLLQVITARSFDALTSLIPANKLPFVVDLMLSGVLISIEPPERKQGANEVLEEFKRLAATQ